MNLPISGFSLILSVLIILVAQIWRAMRYVLGRGASLVTSQRIRVHERNPLGALGIIVSISLISLLQFGFIIDRALRADESLPAVTFFAQREPCIPFDRTLGDRTVILRLDDVQAFAWRDVSMRIIEEGLSRTFPTVAVTIPLGLSQDTELTHFLQNNECNLEIALHGWNHRSVVVDGVTQGEFSFLSYNEATRRLLRGRSELSQVSDKQVTTFVPPENQISDSAAQAVQDQGMPIISSEGDGFFDYDASSWNFDTQEFIPAKTIIQTCESRFDAGDELCIIMLHPEDFAHADGSLDTERFAEYVTLLNYLTDEHIAVITFREVVD